jgi:transcriptional regulator with XRE-family HTH domain
MVLQVFGKNLRQLTAQRGSIAGVAAALDISRVQYQRFLKGEAFPKPQVLNRICAYFGVDARILLTPLDQTPAPKTTAPVPPGLDPELAAALGWAINGNRYPIKPDLIEPGLYRYWVADGYHRDTYHCMAVQIGTQLGRGGQTLRDLRTWRAYFHRSAFRTHGDPGLRGRREVRGLILGVPDGLISLIFNPAPILRVALMHLAPNPIFADGSFTGFVAWGRSELVGFGRSARIFVEKVPPKARNILACARIRSPMPGADVPPRVMQHLNRPMDWPGAY